eukprot:scaffold49593_cov63-Phaeocystis_antarctica.AAC.2
MATCAHWLRVERSREAPSASRGRPLAGSQGPHPHPRGFWVAQTSIRGDSSPPHPTPEARPAPQRGGLLSHRGQTGLSKPAVRAVSSLRRADWPLFRSQPYSKSRPLTTAQVTAFYLLLGGVALGVPLMLTALRAAARPCWSRRSARVRARVRSSARCSAVLLLGGAGALSAHLAALAPQDSTVRPVVPAAAGPVTHGSRRPPALPCALRTAALWPAERSYGRLGPVVPPYSLLCKAPPESPSSQRLLRDPAVYFVCEGVEGGIATGATWPVPPCFLDHTAASAAAAAVAAAAGADPAKREANALRGAPAAEACAQELVAAWLGYGVASVLLLLGAASCLLRGCRVRMRDDPPQPSEIVYSIARSEPVGSTVGSIRARTAKSVRVSLPNPTVTSEVNPPQRVTDVTSVGDRGCSPITAPLPRHVRHAHLPQQTRLRFRPEFRFRPGIDFPPVGLQFIEPIPRPPPSPRPSWPPDPPTSERLPGLWIPAAVNK